MVVARLGKIVRAVTGQHVVADELQQQRVKGLEAVRVIDEIAKQDVVLQEKLVVVAAFDEKKPVLQQRIGVLIFLAEKRTACLGDGSLFHFAPDAAKSFTDLTDHVLAVGLQIGDLRAHHVGLLAVFKQLAAPADPILALDQNARELVARFLADELQQRQVVQHVGFDRLYEFRARDRFLQDFREHLAKRGMLGRAGLLAVSFFFFAVEQVDVDRLTNQVSQIFARKFDKPRAQKNVVMNVVDAKREAGQPDFG